MLTTDNNEWQFLLRHHVNDLIYAIYKGILQREPDLTGLNYYAQFLTKLDDITEIIKSLISSNEFREKFFLEFSSSLVRASYQGVLGRDPDPKGFDEYANILINSDSLAYVLSSLISSEEFKNKSSCFSPLQELKVEKKRDPTFSITDLENPKLVFLHHPKTGGTTLHNILSKEFRSDEICPERFNRLHHYSIGELVRYRFFSGHFDLPSVKLIPGQKKVITMLREPVARLVSLYYFQRAHKPEVIERDNLVLAKLANKYSLTDFFKAEEVQTHPSINNSMTRVLTETDQQQEQKTNWQFHDLSHRIKLAIQEIETLHAFGILERYEASIQLICGSLRLTIPSKVEPKQVLETIMQTEADFRWIDREPISNKTKEAIEELVQFDMELYKHACAIFEQRLTINK